MLVVGGGVVALEKVQGLLACGARVTVVAPRIEPELRALDVEWLPRRYRRDDLAGRFLVIAATSDTAVNTSVHQDAERALPVLQRRRRAGALLADPARGASPGADRGGRLDGRRLACARPADPRRRSARRSGPSTRSSPWSCRRCGRGRSGTCRPTRTGASTSSGSSSRRSRDRPARRRRPRRPGADHGAGPRADPRLRRARARPSRVARARRRGAGRRARDRPRLARPGQGERAPGRLRARGARRRPAQGRRPVRVRARRRGGARADPRRCGGRGRPRRLVVRGGALGSRDPGHAPRGRLSGDGRRGARRRRARLRRARRGTRYARLLHGARAAAPDRPPSRRAREGPRDARRGDRRGDAARPAAWCRAAPEIAAAAAELPSPALVVVGDVVSLAAELAAPAALEGVA